MKRVSMVLAFFFLGCDLSGEGLSRGVTAGDTPSSLPHRGPAPLDGGAAIFDAGAVSKDVRSVDLASVDAGVLPRDIESIDLVALDVRVTIIVDAVADARDGYTSAGVTAHLGTNPCIEYYSAHGYDAVGWLPAASGNGTCYTSQGICGSKPSCGTYAPGALFVWNATDARYKYLGDPSGGYVCLPNDAPYVVPC